MTDATRDATDRGNATAVERNKQLVRFLKAFSQQRESITRTLAEQLWKLELDQLPKYPTITVGRVTIVTAESSAEEGNQEPSSAPLLLVKRPDLKKGPEVPTLLEEWVVARRDDPSSEPHVIEARNVTRDDELVTEQFDDSKERVTALSEWRKRWNAWAEAEKPARAAMKEFERLYELYSRIQRESESVELVLGDGRLTWRPEVGNLVDHPVLLQRVELEFDSDVPEFRVVDSDRAPELYGALFEGSEAPPSALEERRKELERQGYHPLAVESSGFLRSLIQLVSARGTYHEKFAGAAASSDPVIARGPVLFLRKRGAGYAAAFDRVLAHLEQCTELPPSLTSVVGVEPPRRDTPPVAPTLPWCAPPDVLLSKPANAEQVQIARAVQREGAVLVQGPPGTGKTYTIANLVGHLVAHGKRVLVTSHTTKALRVLREQVVETLQPLCLAVLENDVQANAQLGQSVRDIVSRLTASNKEDLEQEVASLTTDRGIANETIHKLANELRIIRALEYESIVVAGESISPSDASRWVADQREGNEWIPGPIEQGAPLPINPDAVRELYETNDTVSLEVDRELLAGLVDPGVLPTGDQFEKLVGALDARDSDQHMHFWERLPQSDDERLVDSLHQLLSGMAEVINAYTGWRRSVVAAGYAGGASRDVWLKLHKIVTGSHELWESSHMLLLEHQVNLGQLHPNQELLADAASLRLHVEQGKSLGWSALFFKKRWKALLDGITVNDARPTSARDFAAIEAEIKLQQQRAELERYWLRVAEPAGFAKFSSTAVPPEPKLFSVTGEFHALLEWWHLRWSEVTVAAGAAGFRLAAFREQQMAGGELDDPFERDCQMVSGSLQKIVAERLAAIDGVIADEASALLADTLASSPGEFAMELRKDVVARDVNAYRHNIASVDAVRSKYPTWKRRHELLTRLRPAAPHWARAISDRTAPHGSATPPGESANAWRWQQLAQETERRRRLDEKVATSKLEAALAELTRLTTELIDRRAWLAQLRRVDLPARQSLLGWTAIQKRIGRGTGIRVPTLQAEARKLLMQARDAVPVWIMPMSRVAESFDPSQGRFDVVILDEASQSDVTGLLAWYLGDSVIVVGDDEQVSPLAVGKQQAVAASLIAQHLIDVPNSVLFDGQLSVYDLAKQSFGGVIALREHFRCVPDIIGFSNELSYSGTIQPLRDGTAIEAPHVIEYRTNGFQSTSAKQNIVEAQTIAALIKAITEDPRYDSKSIGAISLVGDEQAELILRHTIPLVGPSELERRRFAAGTPPEFQGDERDIILLSMVDSPKGGLLPIRQTDVFKKRYNVAASRARDYLWLIHSLEPARDLKDGDLRRRLIEYVRDPGASWRVMEKTLMRAESPFEQAVIKELMTRGYQVKPQVCVGKYRIDMVVSGGAKQVAIECDGDRYHGVDQIPADMARQAILERAGWRFIRIRGTFYFRDPKGSVEWLVEQLNAHGVLPEHRGVEASMSVPATDSTHDSIIRRAHEIMRENGWMPPLPDLFADEQSDGSGLTNEGVNVTHA